jgi:hypothetical protein
VSERPCRTSFGICRNSSRSPRSTEVPLILIRVLQARGY